MNTFKTPLDKSRSRDPHRIVSSTSLRSSRPPTHPNLVRIFANRRPQPRAHLQNHIHLAPATILQQTSATRPSAVPCKRASFLPSFPVPVQKETAYILACTACAYVYCVPGMAFSWSTSAVHRIPSLPANQERISSSAMLRAQRAARE